MIPKHKIVDCSRCPAEGVPGRKRGIEYICLECCKRDDVLKQMDKAKKKHALVKDTSKIKSLGKEQNRDIAERSSLIADIDREFSFYIRLREADKYGYTTCFTSGKRTHYLKLDCGHYISRVHLATRWDVDNCRPQSKHDNQILSGNIEVFKENLEKETPGITEILYERSKEVWKPTTNELKELLQIWRQKAKLVKSKLIAP